MFIYLDGIQVPFTEGQSVLQAALAHGVYIPHLCGHPALEAIGGCRLCVVELEDTGEVVPACMTSAEDGLRVCVKSPKAEAVRRAGMELILAAHPDECSGCPKYGNCELQTLYQYMGVSPERWRAGSNRMAGNESNPLIQHNPIRCIQCTRCIRACDQLRGVGILELRRENGRLYAGTKDKISLRDAGCRFCGACVAVCPTGAIMDQNHLLKDGLATEQTIVPCRNECPAGVDVPAYLRLIRDGRPDEALDVVRERVTMPYTLGSICNHACENKCKRGELSDPLSICRLKQFAAAEGTYRPAPLPKVKTGRKAAVIGGGPAGLSTAYYLALKGHEVTVFEAASELGGQCRWGIPAYRLPVSGLQRDIDAILAAGIQVELNQTVTKPKALLDQGFSAVVLAIGTHLGSRLPIPGSDLPEVYSSVEFLRSVRQGIEPPLGRRVVIIGGGNVAFDCARTAVRLGAESVTVACLERRPAMLADPVEVKEAEEEGVTVVDGVSFLQITGDSCVTGVEIKRVESFSFDSSGRLNVTLQEGSEEQLLCETAIFAVGQKPANSAQMGLPLVRGCYFVTNDAGATAEPGVFAVGDCVTGTKSVIGAIAAARKCAAAVDSWLGGDGVIKGDVSNREKPAGFLGKRAGFADWKRIAMRQQAADARKHSFDLVELGYTRTQAEEEASRCLQCDLRCTIPPVQTCQSCQRTAEGGAQ